MSRARRTHVFLALGINAAGETTLGIRVARALEQAGDRAVFVADESAARLFQGETLERVAIPCRAGPENELRIDDCIRAERPASIVLADGFMTERMLRRMRIDPRFLTRYGTPIVAIDLWCFRETGLVQDTFRGKEEPLAPWIGELPLRLTPVPIARPVPAPGACALLPEAVRLTDDERRHARAALGIGPSDRAILFPTSSWQHSGFDDADGLRLAEAAPRLLGRYLAALGPTVRLLHVGPAPLGSLAEALGLERYRFFSSLPALRFRRALASADLLLSLNVPATTIATAIASSIPVVAIASSRDEGAVFPFWLWPIGYRRFLEPLLRANPYLDALAVVELCDEAGVVATLEALLFEPAARAALAARQAAYVESVERLPRAPEVIDSLLSRP